jgi:hypothetical protein
VQSADAPLRQPPRLSLLLVLPSCRVGNCGRKKERIKGNGVASPFDWKQPRPELFLMEMREMPVGARGMRPRHVNYMVIFRLDCFESIKQWNLNDDGRIIGV